MILTDEEIIDGLIGNDEQVIRYFFYEKCRPMLGYIIKRIYVYQVEKDELVNELYIYLQTNNWHKLRQFDYRSKLTTWLSVVAVRFFRKRRELLIERDALSTLIFDIRDDYLSDRIILKMDVQNALDKMPNARYREVIHALYIEDMEPQKISDTLGITIDNLYNIKHRALSQLSQIIKKEDGYDRSF